MKTEENAEVKQTICKVVGCENPHNRAYSGKRGYCNKHYKKWLKYGDPTAGREYGQSSRAICSIEGCDGVAVARGWCSKHYSAWQRHGDPMAGADVGPTGKVPEGFLSVKQAAQSLDISEGAVHQAVKRGTLKAEKRNNRWIIRSEAIEEFRQQPKRVSNIAECKWEGCQKRARAHGLCSTHYQQARYTAEHEHLIPVQNRAPRCLVEDCDKPQYSKGLCRAHDAQEKYGVTDPLIPAVEGEADQNTAGGRIKQLRIRQGLTLAELGSRVGTTQEWVRQVELKEHLSSKTLFKFASALGVNADQLDPTFDTTINTSGAGTITAKEETSWHLAECPYCAGSGIVEMRPVHSNNNGKPQ